MSTVRSVEASASRQQFASKLYAIEIELGIIYGTVNNEDDSEAASEQLDALIVRVATLRKEYES